jgi:hypothetical protein
VQTEAHLTIESRLPPGRWSWIATAEVARDRSLFARLAGVGATDDQVSIHAPKGLPFDATAETRLAADQCDWHTPTWFSLDELTGHDWQEYTPTWGAIIEVMKAWTQSRLIPVEDEVRVIMWFES